MATGLLGQVTVARALRRLTNDIGADFLTEADYLAFAMGASISPEATRSFQKMGTGIYRGNISEVGKVGLLNPSLTLAADALYIFDAYANSLRVRDILVLDGGSKTTGTIDATADSEDTIEDGDLDFTINVTRGHEVLITNKPDELGANYLLTRIKKVNDLNTIVTNKLPADEVYATDDEFSIGGGFGPVTATTIILTGIPVNLIEAADAILQHLELHYLGLPDQSTGEATITVTPIPLQIRQIRSHLRGAQSMG